MRPESWQTQNRSAGAQQYLQTPRSRAGLPVVCDWSKDTDGMLHASYLSCVMNFNFSRISANVKQHASTSEYERYHYVPTIC